MGQYSMIVTVGLFVTTLGFITAAGGNTIFEYDSGGASNPNQDVPEVPDDGNILDIAGTAIDYAGWIIGSMVGGGSGYSAFNIIIGGTLTLLAGFVVVAIIRGLA